VEFGDDGLEEFAVEMGVNLGGGDADMPQEFLHEADIPAAFEDVGGKGVAEGVGRVLFIGEGAFEIFFHDAISADAGEGFSESIEEEDAVIGGFFPQEIGSSQIDVFNQSISSLGTERDKSGAVPLAGHSHDFIFEEDIGEAEGSEFGDSEPAAVEDFQHRTVSETGGRG